MAITCEPVRTYRIEWASECAYTQGTRNGEKNIKKRESITPHEYCNESKRNQPNKECVCVF